ncbi:hypothetical protein SteCoe_922 [Stentor coeruleus]|uniref:Uncharacterized protein n=1 Tax=Stentor coeruleus TaxID=5963 RepID=A0A1R2D345_9CILI|nr:hypothetical protein SteCoe_922 [Stentor coeruleus]
MCNFNVYCQLEEGTCKCHEKAMIQGQNNMPPTGFKAQNNNLLMFGLLNMITQQNKLIQSAYTKMKDVLEIISNSHGKSNEKDFNNKTFPDQITCKSTLQAYLCGANPHHTCSLMICSDIPTPAYKERCFSILLRLVDNSEKFVTLTNAVMFKVNIYTTENPPKLLTLNTSGEKLIRGTDEVNSKSIIFFSKIIINEVSSRYLNGALFLVFMPQNADFIQPLIIEDFVIKARKPDTARPSKRIKRSETEKPGDE